MKKISVLVLFIILGLSALYSASLDDQTQFAQFANVIIAIALFYSGLKLSNFIK